LKSKIIASREILSSDSFIGKFYQTILGFIPILQNLFQENEKDKIVLHLLFEEKLNTKVRQRYGSERKL
jgi:hypothetical protein